MHRGVYYINALPLSPFQFLVFFCSNRGIASEKKVIA